MPTKLYILNGKIVRSERVDYDEIILTDIELNDSPVIENGVVIPFSASEAAKKMQEQIPNS